MNSKLFFKSESAGNILNGTWIRGILFWRNVYTCFQKFLTKWETDIDCRSVFVNCRRCSLSVYTSDPSGWREAATQAIITLSMWLIQSQSNTQHVHVQGTSLRGDYTGSLCVHGRREMTLGFPRINWVFSSSPFLFNFWWTLEWF